MKQRDRHAKSGWLAGFAALFLLLAAVPAMADEAAPAAPAAPALQAKSDAQIAADFKLLQGDGNGLTAEYLGKTTLRYQAAIMSLRLQGLETVATAYTGGEQFADGSLVFGTTRAALGYLKSHTELGWQGSGDGKFDPLAPVTAQQFYKVMLEGLGYKEGTDFQYDDTLAFAKSKGLYRAAISATFRNADIATAVVEALKTPVKGGTDTLAQALVKKGAADASAAAALSYKRLDVSTDAKVGAYLTDDAGRTLYYFTKDVADPNSCKAACLNAWPIYDSDTLDVPAGLQAADFGRFLRADGKTQLTYKGWPLYYYTPDKNPGDVLGEDINHVWFVLKVPDYSVMLATQSSVGGNYLTDNQGRTLYYFDKDMVGMSACSGACLKAWPPFYSPNVVVPTGLDASDFGSLTLADGSMATTYKGYPLYYYVSDMKRGDTTGQAFKNVWYVVNPATFTGTKAQAAMAGMAN